MKKGLLIILSMLLIFVMVSCSTPKQVAETTIQTAAPTITTITTPETTVAVTETTAVATSETTTATTVETTAATTTTEATTTTATVGEAPTIKLSIFDGPSYSGDICYYRVRATVTGIPSPTITFSKDDSNGAFSKNMSQVNLTNNSPNYTLTATAKNSVGQASASIILNWVEPTTTTTAPVQTSGYFEVFRFSGNGSKNSEPFNITGSRFKIAYDCSGELSQAFLYKANGDLVNLIVNVAGPAKDETIFYGKGVYYIEANMIGDFIIVVYDYK